MTDALTRRSESHTATYRPHNFAELERLAHIMADSKFVPKDFQGRPNDCLIAIMCGAEIGLAPTQAVQAICVVNGRPSLWGDALLAVAMAHPAYVGHDETMSDDGTTATCRVERQRRDGQTQVFVSSFSLTDAKRAGLLQKRGPWQDYPQRMLQMRARGFALRDAFADALRGLMPREEVDDYRPIDVAAPPRQAKTEQVRQALRDRGATRTAEVEAPAATPSDGWDVISTKLIAEIDSAASSVTLDAIAKAMPGLMPPGVDAGEVRAAWRQRRDELVRSEAGDATTTDQAEGEHLDHEALAVLDGYGLTREGDDD